MGTSVPYKGTMFKVAISAGGDPSDTRNIPNEELTTGHEKVGSGQYSFFMFCQLTNHDTNADAASTRVV